MRSSRRVRRHAEARSHARREPGSRDRDRSVSRLPSALAAAAVLLPAALSAQSQAPEEPSTPLIGDRPDFTESAAVVSRLQLETGYSYEEAGPSGVHTLGELLVRVPATPRLEIRVAVPSWSWARTTGSLPDDGPQGVTDASLGVKVGLRDPGPDGRGPRVALLAGTTIPTGGEVGSDALQPGGRLAAGVDLGDRLSLAANAGVTSAEDGVGRHAELVGSLSLGVGLTRTVAAYLESYGIAPTGDGRRSSSVVDGGVTWQPGPDLQLDVRLGTGVSGPSPDLIVGAGVVWRP